MALLRDPLNVVAVFAMGGGDLPWGGSGGGMRL